MEKEEIRNPRWPHTVRIARTVPGKGEEDNPFAEEDAPLEDEERVLYEGRGRSYTDTTTTGDKNVDENKRKVSVPVRVDEWDEGQVPLDGDAIEVRMGKYVERGTVKDCEPDNGRTVVYWELRRV